MATMPTPYELAKRYYPRLWDKSRIEELVEAGLLTKEEAAQIMKEQGGNRYESE